MTRPSCEKPSCDKALGRSDWSSWLEYFVPVQVLQICFRLDNITQNIKFLFAYCSDYEPLSVLNENMTSTKLHQQAGKHFGSYDKLVNMARIVYRNRVL